MIAAALALLLASPSEAATTREVVEEIQEHTALCREGLRHWDAGDGDWMEREMVRLGFSAERKQARRILCLYYIQGVLDLQTQLGLVPKGRAAPQPVPTPRKGGKTI